MDVYIQYCLGDIIYNCYTGYTSDFIWIMWPHVVRSLAWWWMDSRNTLGPLGLCCFILTIFRLVTYFNSARAMVRENQPILAIPATNINSRRPCHDLGVGRFSLSDMPNTILPHGLSTVIGTWSPKLTKSEASWKEDNSQYNYNPFSFLFGWLITQCVSQRVHVWVYVTCVFAGQDRIAVQLHVMLLVLSYDYLLVI